MWMSESNHLGFLGNVDAPMFFGFLSRFVGDAPFFWLWATWWLTVGMFGAPASDLGSGTPQPSTGWMDFTQTCLSWTFSILRCLYWLIIGLYNIYIWFMSPKPFPPVSAALFLWLGASTFCGSPGYSSGGAICIREPDHCSKVGPTLPKMVVLN